jgi:hypothetical protein
MIQRNTFGSLAFLVIVLIGAAASPLAQTPVTASDITRLETSADDAATQIGTLRKTDASLATELDKNLAALRDDITYLKVKLRRDGGVTRTEYLDVRDGLDRLQARARGGPPAPPGGDAVRVGARRVPAGTEIDVRVQTPMNTAAAKTGDRFELISLLDVKIGDEVVIPAGSLVHGFVSSVRGSGKIDHRGSLTLSFEEIVIGTASLRLRASVEQALDGKALSGKAVDDTTRLDLGGSASAIIGVSATLVGVFIGPGGTIASTEGKDVDLPLGTILRIRLDEAVDARVPISR